MNRRSLIGSLLTATLAVVASLVTGCGGGTPKRINPPVHTHTTRTQAEDAARLQALDIGAAGRLSLVVPVTGATHSMGDLLGPGDILVADITGGDEYGKRVVGEVIVYAPSGPDWEGTNPGASLIAHRIVERDSHGLILSGDANPRSESRSRVTIATYVGLVVGIHKVA